MKNIIKNPHQLITINATVNACYRMTSLSGHSIWVLTLHTCKGILKALYWEERVNHQRFKLDQHLLISGKWHMPDKEQFRITKSVDLPSSVANDAEHKQLSLF